MIVNKSNILLFIEPKNDKSAQPVDDELTLFIEKLLTIAINSNQQSCVVRSDGFIIRGLATMGLHQCRCGEHSHNHDYEIYKDFYTNSLAAHYLRYHRSEVSTEELEKVKKLMSLIIC